MNFLLLCSCSLLAIVGYVNGDADFMSVRTSLTRDHSGKDGDPKEKYFHESTFHYHYDGRFASQTLPDEKAHSSLTALIQTYLSAMRDVGAETWIMHGTLLAWWWNQKIFPWDSDLDVQVSEPTIHFLANYYNMTEYHFELPEIEDSRTYLLEINPRYIVSSIDDWLNVIDARWIDTTSGLFIDITAVRKDITGDLTGNPGVLMCKDGHVYVEDDIFPLRDSHFEDLPVKISYAYIKLLQNEYGSASLTRTRFSGYGPGLPVYSSAPSLRVSLVDVLSVTDSTTKPRCGNKPNPGIGLYERLERSVSSNQSFTPSSKQAVIRAYYCRPTINPKT